MLTQLVNDHIFERRVCEGVKSTPLSRLHNLLNVGLIWLSVVWRVALENTLERQKAFYQLGVCEACKWLLVYAFCICLYQVLIILAASCLLIHLA